MLLAAGLHPGPAGGSKRFPDHLPQQKRRGKERGREGKGKEEDGKAEGDGRGSIKGDLPPPTGHPGQLQPKFATAHDQSRLAQST